MPDSSEKPRAAQFTAVRHRHHHVRVHRLLAGELAAHPSAGGYFGWLKGRSHPASPPAAVTVLVVDFQNATGDTVFNGTLEPMLNLGTKDVRRCSDGWTVRTVDGRTSAHYEHTVVATAAGPVVLGFGRFTENGSVPGMPEVSEYPVVTAARPGAGA